MRQHTLLCGSLDPSHDAGDYPFDAFGGGILNRTVRPSQSFRMIPTATPLVRDLTEMNQALARHTFVPLNFPDNAQVAGHSA
jgi:hypothetical protein